MMGDDGDMELIASMDRAQANLSLDKVVQAVEHVNARLEEINHRIQHIEDALGVRKDGTDERFKDR